MLFEKNDRILFTGDSITDCGRARPAGEGRDPKLGNGYVQIIDGLLQAVYPELSLRVTNTGSSGDDVLRLAARWQTDVIDLHPDWLSVCIGVNDVWRQFDEPTLTDHHVSLETYRETYDRLIASVRPSLKGMFILAPYYLEPNKTDFMRARMDEYGATARELAEKYNCIFIDLQAEFGRFLAVRHANCITWDRVHPNRIGCAVISRAVLTVSGFDYYRQY